MAYTRYSKKLGPGQNLYTQKFRIQVRILVVGVYSILEFFGAGQAPDLERIQKARKVRPRAGSVYSNFPGPGRFLFWGVYRKLEKPGPGRNPYTQIFRIRAGSWSRAYTRYSKKLGPGRNQYTQIFRAQAGSCSGAYTRYSKKLGPGRNLYTQIFRAQADSWSIAYTEGSKIQGLWAKSVYSKIQGPGRFLFWGVYKILEKTGPRQNLYTQKFRARAGSWPKAYTCVRKKLKPRQSRLRI